MRLTIQEIAEQFNGLSSDEQAECYELIRKNIEGNPYVQADVDVRRIFNEAKSIVNSVGLSWEEKYNQIFSDKISSKVIHLFDYYDPDMDYDDDVHAFMDIAGVEIHGDNLSNKWVILLFSHTPKQWTYWLTESQDRPDFSDSFMTLLHDINYYDSSDIFEHIKKLKEDEVDLNKVDFEREDYIREHLHDVQLVISFMYLGNGWSSGTYWNAQGSVSSCYTTHINTFVWNNFVEDIENLSNGYGLEV